MNDLQVEFGDPDHGWIEISITSGDTNISLEADPKYNSFCDLINGLTSLLDAVGSLARGARPDHLEV